MDTPRISKPVGVAMIVIVFILDSIQLVAGFILLLIPLIGIVLATVCGWMVSVFTAFLFGIWFSHYNVSLLDSKRAWGLLLTLIGEFAPGANAGYWWTWLVFYTVLKEWRKKTDI